MAKSILATHTNLSSYILTLKDQSINQSINQIAIAPISSVRPGSVARKDHRQQAFIWRWSLYPALVQTFSYAQSYSRHPSILSHNGKHHGSGHVVLSLVKARLEWPLQGANLAKSIWRPCAAHTTRPPSRPHWPDPRECRAIHLESAWLQGLPEGSHHWHPAAWGTLLLICLLDLLP